MRDLDGGGGVVRFDFLFPLRACSRGIRGVLGVGSFVKNRVSIKSGSGGAIGRVPRAVMNGSEGRESTAPGT